MKKTLLPLLLLTACASTQKPAESLPYTGPTPVTRPPPGAPPPRLGGPVPGEARIGPPPLPPSPNRRTLPATPAQQERLGIWAADQNGKPNALAVITSTRPPGVPEEAWADCEQRVREVMFDQGTLGWEQKELFAGLTAKDAACLWERLMRQCVADRGTASSAEQFEDAMAQRISSACQGVDNRRNSPTNVLFRGIHFWGQSHQWTSITRRNREAGLRTEPIPLPPMRQVPPSALTVTVPSPPQPPAPVQKPKASQDPATLHGIIEERAAAAPASTTREAWARCWQDVVELLRGEPDVLLLTPVELRCLRTRLLTECGSILLDRAKDYRSADTGSDFLDRYFPARQWDSEGWANQRDNVERKRCQQSGGLTPFVRNLNRRLTDKAEAGWKHR